MSDAKQNPGINPIVPKITETIYPSANVNSNSALIGVPSTINVSEKNNYKSGKSDADKADRVAISPLADKLSQNLPAQKENILSHDYNKIVEEHSGRESVTIPKEREKVLESTSKSPETSSEVPLNKIKGEKEGYWDQLIIRDSMLVLQERLGGMNAASSALNSMGNMSKVLSQAAISGGNSAGKERVSPIEISAINGNKKPDYSGNAIEQLMRDCKEAQAKGARLSESTQQIMSMALRTAGIDSGAKDNGFRRGFNNQAMEGVA